MSSTEPSEHWPVCLRPSSSHRRRHAWHRRCRNLRAQVTKRPPRAASTRRRSIIRAATVLQNDLHAGQPTSLAGDGTRRSVDSPGVAAPGGPSPHGWPPSPTGNVMSTGRWARSRCCGAGTGQALSSAGSSATRTRSCDASGGDRRVGQVPGAVAVRAGGSGRVPRGHSVWNGTGPGRAGRHPLTAVCCCRVRIGHRALMPLTIGGVAVVAPLVAPAPGFTRYRFAVT